MPKSVWKQQEFKILISLLQTSRLCSSQKQINFHIPYYMVGKFTILPFGYRLMVTRRLLRLVEGQLSTESKE